MGDLVVTEDPGWENTVVVRGALADEIAALKSQPGMDVVATGSIALVRGLVPLGVVDEYRLFVHPVVLGRGQRLFAEATDVPRLRLVATQPFRSGVVLLRYRPAQAS